MSDEQETTSPKPKTPGEILKAAREARGYLQSFISERLRLSVQTIIDIDNDDYSHFHAEVYLRGHMRSYARLVNVEESIVLQALAGMNVEMDSDKTAPILMDVEKPVSHQARRSKRKLLWWAGIGIFLLLVMMVMLWWNEQQHPSAPHIVQPLSPELSSEKTVVNEAPKTLLPETQPKKVSHKKVTYRKVNQAFKADYVVTPVKE